MSAPVCGFVHALWDGGTPCPERGPHRCAPRGQKVVDFFEKVLVHPKGIMARKPFLLEDWQEDEIIRPLFETVDYKRFAGSYARVYSQAWLELARKSGKSTLVAGIILYMLVWDDENAGENYIGARDRNQASIIFNTAAQMVEMSPVLSKHLVVLKGNKRIVHEASKSILQVISSDAMSALGFNPHGAALDEIVAHPNGELWDSMNTATGARKQPLLIAATTAGTDVSSFAGDMHKEMEKVAEDPSRAPHIFVYMRNTPMDADPWDEENWYHANPGLGRYLDINELRKQATEAKNQPSREIAFRTYRLNQWTQVASRWMSMLKYDASTGQMWSQPNFGRTALEGRSAFAGLDLSATTDMTAWCVAVVPENEGEPVDLLWRFWISEESAAKLDEQMDGQLHRWAKEGWVTICDGNTIDYNSVYEGIVEDMGDFNVLEVDYDPYVAPAVLQRIEELAGKKTQFVKVQQHYAQMSPAMTSVMSSVESQRFHHHGNPVARWHFDSVEVQFSRENPDLIRPVKADRKKDSKRIDGVVSAALAMGAFTLRGDIALRKSGPKGRRPGKRAFAFN